jgi:hypothetical protein
MKKIQVLLSAFCMLLLFSTKVHAVSMGEVVGQVIEKESNQPVAFAEITFENRMDKIDVKANEYGHYYASHLPTGKYQMRVVYNNRVFVMNDVKVFDGYASEIKLVVSNSNSLPSKVVLETKENIFSSVTSNDVKLTNSSFNQPTQSLNDVISQQPGCDVRNGKIYIKGSDQVRFFIDGEPVMGTPTETRVW